MLGKLPLPGRLTNLVKSKARPTGLALDAGRGCLDFSSLVYHLSRLSLFRRRPDIN